MPLIIINMFTGYMNDVFGNLADNKVRNWRIELMSIIIDQLYWIQRDEVDLKEIAHLLKYKINEKPEKMSNLDDLNESFKSNFQNEFQKLFSHIESIKLKQSENEISIMNRLDNHLQEIIDFNKSFKREIETKISEISSTMEINKRLVNQNFEKLQQVDKDFMMKVDRSFNNLKEITDKSVIAYDNKIKDFSRDLTNNFENGINSTNSKLDDHIKLILDSFDSYKTKNDLKLDENTDSVNANAEGLFNAVITTIKDCNSTSDVKLQEVLKSILISLENNNSESTAKLSKVLDTVVDLVNQSKFTFLQLYEIFIFF